MTGKPESHPDLIDQYGIDAVGEMILEVMKEMGCELPRDVFDRLMRYEKLTTDLRHKWKDTDGFYEAYVPGLLWNRLTPERQEQVLKILEKDLDE